MGTNPAKSAENAHRAQHRPVEWVTWIEANEFCQKLTEMEQGEPWARKGWAFRLPTEAEWEFAARAGAETPFAFGDQIIFERHALFNWSEDDPRGVLSADRDPAKLPKAPLFPQEVGKTEPNRFGLCDLHGNVAEWCLDWYRPVYRGGGGQGPDRPRGRRPARDPRRLVPDERDRDAHRGTRRAPPQRAPRRRGVPGGVCAGGEVVGAVLHRSVPHLPSCGRMQHHGRLAMKSYQISLPDEIASFVDRVLAEKKWDTIDSFVAYALLQVESELRLEEFHDLDSLRKAVQIGIDQADRGELVDGPTVMKRLRDKLEAARKQPT